MRARRALDARDTLFTFSGLRLLSILGLEALVSPQDENLMLTGADPGAPTDSTSPTKLGD